MKMKFIKIAKYGSNVPVAEKYLFYCDSAQQKSDPEIDLPISLQSNYNLSEYQHVYSSPLKRALSSAHYLSQSVVVVPQLTEIAFDLTKLLTGQEYIERGSSLVRERFVQAFIQDTLIESRKEIISRVRDVVKYLVETNRDDVVCVSHSFFMKVVEAYLNEVDLLRNPSELANFIVPSIKTYSYGGGFTIKVQSMRGDL